MQQPSQKKLSGIATLMSAKQQLDERRILGNVTLQSAPVVLKLLQLIKKLQRQIEEKNADSTLQQTTREQDEALIFQLKELTSQNNVLRLQVLSLQDELDVQKLKIQDLCTQSLNISSEKSTPAVLKEFKKRQEQLRQTVIHTAFKYNELMDLLHQNPTKEREYIKRLLKHKAISLPDNYPTQEILPPKLQNIYSSNHMRISTLEAQLLARNAEITRLQSLLVDECVDIARRKWYNRSQNQQIELLKDEIASLTSQNQQLRNLLSQSILPKPNPKSIRSHSNYSNLRTGKFKSKQQVIKFQEYDSLKECSAKPRLNNMLRLKTSPQEQLAENYNNQVNDDPYHIQKKRKVSKTQKLKTRATQGLQIDNTLHKRELLLENEKIRQHFTQNLDLQNNKKHQQQKNIISTNMYTINPPKQQKRQSTQKYYTKPTSPRGNAVINQPKKKDNRNFDQQQRKHYQNELHQKEQKIAELKELLRLSPRKASTIINKTQNIHSQQSQTNNLIINSNLDQAPCPGVNKQKEREAHLQGRLNQMQMELRETIREKEQLEKQLDSFLHLEHLKQEQDKLKETIRIQRQGRESAEMRLRQTQQQLISVNQQNISLLNKQAKHSEGQLAKAQVQIKGMSQNNEDPELWRLRREVERLKRQLTILQVEKAVLYKQLNQTQTELRNQSREMECFQRNLGNRYRLPSP